jgi:peptidoglycan/xylan/chitin deacetylase (PgdA/CDA1 family)
MKKILKTILIKLHLLITFKKILNIFSFLKRKITSIFFSTSTMLLYHRVADISDDPHQLSVSIRNFESQIKYLNENFNIISLPKLISNINNKIISNNDIVITFDDGYYDNFQNALPILRKFNAPATIFITAGNIDKESPFYWDKRTKKDNQGRALTTKELVELSRSELITIGAHTMTHPVLTEKNDKEIKWEINESKKIIENIINKKIYYFSYPFGGKNTYNKYIIKLLQKTGFEGSCANFHDSVSIFSNKYALPRKLIRDWDSNRLSKEINKI